MSILALTLLLDVSFHPLTPSSHSFSFFQPPSWIPPSLIILHAARHNSKHPDVRPPDIMHKGRRDVRLNCQASPFLSLLDPQIIRYIRSAKEYSPNRQNVGKRRNGPHGSISRRQRPSITNKVQQRASQNVRQEINQPTTVRPTRTLDSKKSKPPSCSYSVCTIPDRGERCKSASTVGFGTRSSRLDDRYYSSIHCILVHLGWHGVPPLNAVNNDLGLPPSMIGCLHFFLVNSP